MDIQLERKTDGCFSDNCPARYRVVGAPGGAVFIGRELDEETLAKIEDKIGPGERAVFVPEELL